jgi:23S rRNA (guanosine2251-2'-O)-methyltransferase
MQKESIKFENSTILEGMTSLRALFDGKKRGCNDRPVLRLLYDEARADKLYKELSYLRAMSKEHDFPIIPSKEEEIDALAVGNSHGGLLAECGVRTLSSLHTANDIAEAGFYAMIQGIEDPYNFGYAIRSLYACGVDGIILPERNWLSAAGVVTRSSAGASEMLPVYVSDPMEAADFFHGRGYTVVCADERTEHLLHKTPLKKPILLIVGGERRGISRALLDKADLLVKIGYGREFRASLSAASATTMMAYEIFRQNCD